MGILANAIERRAYVVNLGHPGRYHEGTAKWIGAGTTSDAGVSVTATSAMKLTAVYCGVRILAESVAHLPLDVLRMLKGGGAEKAIDDPLYPLLHDAPNSEMTSADWLEFMMGCAAINGVAYSEIEVVDGRPVAFWPLPWENVQPFRLDDGTLVYKYTSVKDGRVFYLDQRRVLPFRGFSMNGYTGMSIWQHFAQSLGVAIATEEHAARFFGSGAQLGGILSTDSPLSQKARANTKEAWEYAQAGIGKAHRTAVLDSGLKWTPITLDAEKSQLLASRKFTVSEVARILRVPPHKLMDLERATFSNIEQQSLDFVTDTLMPWLVRIERRMNMSLFTAEDRKRGLYVKFNVRGLLRGDMAARSAFYVSGVNGGWFSPDEVREWEDLNPQPDGVGKVYARPKNTDFVGTGAPPATA